MRLRRHWGCSCGNGRSPDMLLRGNLATRPFYNERLVSAGIIVLALVAVGLTVFNLARLTSLSSRRSALRAEIAVDEAQSARIRADARAVQNSVDRAALLNLAGSTQLANALIGARTFSWTIFFSLIEDTIPMGVRVSAVSPDIDEEDIVVTMLLEGRSEEEINRFAQQLEETGAFREVAFTVADTDDDGLKRATMRSVYVAPNVQTGEPAPSTGETGRRP